MIFVVEGNHKKNISNYEKYKTERIKISKKMEKSKWRMVRRRRKKWYLMD